jgi:PAS domain S-box-containing protein
VEQFLPNGRRRHRFLPIIGGKLTLELTAVFAAVLIALTFLDAGMSHAPMLSFVVAISLSAVRFGLPGGVASGLVGVAIAGVWFVHGHYAGGIDFAWHAAAFLFVGCLVGGAVSDRRELERIVIQHAELTLDLICTATFDGYFIRLNPAWKRTLGYEPSELEARPFLDFIHPDDHAATVAEVERQIARGEVVLNFSNRYRHKDGSYRWLEWTSRPDQRAGLLFAVARDVTERKDAEQAIVEYRETLEREVRDRTAELEEARLETLRRLALAAEYRDDETFEHTERVGHTSALIALQLGMPEADAAVLRQAAPLHDVGKLGLSDSILLKPGPLSADEFAKVKRHTVDGAEILSGSSSCVLQVAEQIALNHHERWDGSGYPNGVAGEDIPLPARIVAVADVFDALTHARPYKQAWSIGDALAEIRAQRGTHFDPRILDAFECLDAERLMTYSDENDIPHAA